MIIHLDFNAVRNHRITCPNPDYILASLHRAFSNPFATNQISLCCAWNGNGLFQEQWHHFHQQKC